MKLTWQPPPGTSSQYFAGVAACLSVVTSGSVFGWITPILTHLLGPDSEIPMTELESSWVVSIMELGNMISPIPAGMIVNYVGRKSMLLATGPLYMISWLVIIYWPTVTVLAAMRVFQGLVMGLSFVAGPIYLGEIASNKNRGAITSLFFNSWSVGFLISYAVGPFLNFNSFTYFTLAQNIPFLLLFFWQPETPYYYVLKGDLHNAHESLKWFRGGSAEEIRDELEEIKMSIEAFAGQKTSYRDLFATAGDRRAILLIFILSAVRISSGTGGLLVYVTQVFNQTPNLSVSPDMVTIAFGVVMVLGGIISLFTSDTLGRRNLLLISSFGALVCQTVTGTYYFLLTNTNIPVAQFSWVSPLLILMYCALCTAGMYPVCISYTSELFSDRTRGLASSVGASNCTLFSFISLALFPLLSGWLGLYANFYFYALNSLVGFLYFHSYAPETKGKSFRQIRNEICGSTPEVDHTISPTVRL